MGVVDTTNSEDVAGPSQPSSSKADDEETSVEPKINDPLIVERLNQYLNENKDQSYVDIVNVTEALRRRYREYRKRAWTDFRKLVEQAFNEICEKSKSLRSVTDSSSSDVEECDDPQSVIKSNSNSTMQNLYRAEEKKQLELIDLSSDDEPKKDGKTSVSGIPQELLCNPDLSVVRRQRPSLRNQEKSRRAGPLPTLNISTVTFDDFGGNSAVLEEVCKMIIHVKHPDVFRAFGMSAPRGFLLHGPPGCGKTLLASAIAGELKVPFIKVSGPQLVGGVSGESEERVRELFSGALDVAPCVLFIDEVDAITPNRQTAQREMERRIVAQLITSLDDLATSDPNGQVLVIGATKRPDSLDPALRRAGRFDREVSLGIPDIKAREEILRVVCAKVPLATDLNLETIARMTPGFVGADLLSLIRESAMVAITRIFDTLKIQKSDGRKRKMGQDLAASAKRLHVENKETGEKSDSNDGKMLNGSNEENQAEKGDLSVDDGKMAVDTEQEIDVESTSSKKDEESTGKVVVDETGSEHVPSVLSTLLDWVRKTSNISVDLLKKVTVTQTDLMAALKTVQPSAKREGFATVPDVTWDDIGSLVAIREHLKMTILGPVKYQEQFERLGLVAPAGVLLCGPPGCGKTLLAKAVANEAGINFISVKGPELLNMYVGESERAVRTVFQRARNSAPCVIFFDELDALCPRRNEGDAGAGMRVVNQMLTEMDGVGDRRGVFLMAASNRPDIIDPAVLRPGRLDKIVYIGLPNAEDRKDILRAITKNGTKPPLASDVSLDELAVRPELENWTGADLAALIRESAMQAVRDVMNEVSLSRDEGKKPKDVSVTSAHIQRALLIVRPSISAKDLKRYEEMKLQFSSSPGT